MLLLFALHMVHVYEINTFYDDLTQTVPHRKNMIQKKPPKQQQKQHVASTSPAQV